MQVLETERLTLHRMTPEDDAELILELLNDPAFIENIGDRGVRTLDQAGEYIRERVLPSYAANGFGMYRVSLKEDGAAIGNCGLVDREALDHVDIGFAFLRRHWSKGYATEASRAVMRHAFDDFDLEQLVAVVSPQNQGSINVLHKLGFVFERMIRLPGDTIDIKLFTLEG